MRMIQISMSIFVDQERQPKWTCISSSKYVIHIEVAEGKPSTWNPYLDQCHLVAFQCMLFSDLSGAHYILFIAFIGNVLPNLFFQISSHNSGEKIKT